MGSLTMFASAWSAKDFEFKGESFQSLYLGEAGSTGYTEANYVQAVRLGDEVIVSRKKNDSIIIPANLRAEGFNSDINGKTLKEVMEEGVLYDHKLKKVDLR